MTRELLKTLGLDALVTNEQPAWVLRGKTGDNGLLVEFFTAEWGRCGAVVRGAHRKKRGGSLASLLQPFQPCSSVWLRWRVEDCWQVEAPSPGFSLRGGR